MYAYNIYADSLGINCNFIEFHPPRIYKIELAPRIYGIPVDLQRIMQT